MKWKLLFLFLIFASAAPAQSQWDVWLKNEGYYLLGPKEKEKFQALPEEQKEFYIRDLWNSLDPEPLTPENEFQIDYAKRFEYCKKNFSIPSDRAKVYLLLGAPTSVERHHNSDKYYPLELWSYYSLGFRDLPPSLELIFFKRWGTGDFRLYSPMFDGMKALTPSQMDFDNPKQRAMLKAYFDPQIIEAAEKVSTGAGAGESEEVRMVLQDPDAFNRMIERKNRPTVETTVVYEGFQAEVASYAAPYESGVMKTSVAVSIPPQYLTLEREETTYRGRVDLIGRVTDDKGREILKINDSPALKLNGEEFDKAKGFHFSYLFDCYLLPGKYNLDILYRDYASNAAGKVEKNFTVSAPSDVMDLTDPLIAFKDLQTQSDLPFTYSGRQYIPKENGAFNNGHTVILFTSLQNPKKVPLEGVWKLQMGLRNELTNVLELQEDLPVSGNGDIPIYRKIRLQSLVPGPYHLFVRLIGNNGIYETSAPLRINVAPEVLGRMRVIAGTNRTPELFHSNVALQYFYAGNYELASKHARIALDFAPSSYAARSLNARIEHAKGNVDGAIEAYRKLLAEAPSDSEGFFLVGKWSMQKQDWVGAADSLKKAMDLGYYTTELLNDLAAVEKQKGNVKEAVNYWEKSLALDSNQPDIAKMVAENKKS